MITKHTKIMRDKNYELMNSMYALTNASLKYIDCGSKVVEVPSKETSKERLTIF